MRAAAAASGRAERAGAFVAAELRRVAPRFRWVLPHQFVGKRVAFAGDPHLFGGFLDIAADAGRVGRGAVLTARRGHGGAAEGLPVAHEPSEEDRAAFEPLTEDVDLLVACHLGSLQRRGASATMEAGFPSYRHHAFFERPTLGFDGFAGFLDRMSEALARRP